MLGYLKSGKVRAIAVTTLKRTTILPDLPTMDEAGLKGFEVSTWHGLIAPAGTPPDIIAELHDAAVKALHDPRRAVLARPAGRRYRWRHAKRIRRLYRDGNSEMDGDRESVRRNGG